MKKLILSLVVIATALLVQTDSVDGERPLRRLQRFYTPQNRAATVWHGQYYNATYGMPQAMVLPPNVNTTRSQGWGVWVADDAYLQPVWCRFPGHCQRSQEPFLPHAKSAKPYSAVRHLLHPRTLVTGWVKLRRLLSMRRMVVYVDHVSS